MASNFKSDLRNLFFAGLLVTLPLVFTVFLLHFLFVSLDNLLGPGVAILLNKVGYNIDPAFRLPGLGIVALVLLVLLVGIFARNILGEKIVSLYESILVRIPFAKSIYVGAKQIVETFGKSMGDKFNKVVMIEYPRKGIYALAFTTSKSSGEVVRKTGKEMTNVFLPTTPNPTSGFFLLIPNEEIIDLDMSVEAGIKMIISGGLVTPPNGAKGEPEKIKNGQ